MKKVLALALALVMAFAPTSVFAQQLQMPTSYDFAFELSMQLDVDSPELDAEAMMALALMQDISMSGTGTLVMEDPSNFMAMHLHMDMELYAGFFNVPLALWMDFDFTDMENVEYVIVARLPEMLTSMIAMADPDLARPYWVIDFGRLMSEDAGSQEFFSDFMDGFMFGYGFAGDVLAVLEMFPEMEALEDGRHRLAITNEWYMGLMSTVLEEMAVELAEMLSAEEVEAFELLSELFANVTLLGRPWVTYYTLDENGYAVQEDSSLQIVFDLHEWAEAFIAADPSLSMEDMNDIPEFVVSIDVEYSITYENINSATRVPLPRLTPQNSVDLTELLLAL
jgi:hypothetical protein